VKGKGMMRTYLLMAFHKDAKKKRVPTNLILDGNRTEILQSSPGSSRNGSPSPSQQSHAGCDAGIITQQDSSDPGSKDRNLIHAKEDDVQILQKSSKDPQVDTSNPEDRLDAKACGALKTRVKKAMANLRAVWTDLTEHHVLEKGDRWRLQASFGGFALIYTVASISVVGKVWEQQKFPEMIFMRITITGSVLATAAVFKWCWPTDSNIMSLWLPRVMSLMIVFSFGGSLAFNVTFFTRPQDEYWCILEYYFSIVMLMNFAALCPDWFWVVSYLLVNFASVIIVPDWTGYQIVGSVVQAFNMYVVKTFQLRSQAYLLMIQEEHERIHLVLSTLLPREILDEMKAGRPALAYHYNDMTFLFADIVGFTSYCASHSPEQALNLVTRLFAAFDQCTARLGVYKVCTIGDAYVAVNEPKAKTQADEEEFRVNCVRILNLAIQMLKVIIGVRDEVQHKSLDMRIGIHHGSFVAGVIGTNQLRFDMWGQDVLIANQIESNGVPGDICASHAAKIVLDETETPECNFAFHTDIRLKSGEAIRSYVVRRQDGCKWTCDPSMEDLPKEID